MGRAAWEKSSRQQTRVLAGEEGKAMVKVTLSVPRIVLVMVELMLLLLLLLLRQLLSS